MSRPPGKLPHLYCTGRRPISSTAGLVSSKGAALVHEPPVPPLPVPPVPMPPAPGPVVALWVVVLEVASLVSSLVQATVNIIVLRFFIFVLGSLVLMALTVHAAAAVGFIPWNFAH